MSALDECPDEKLRTALLPLLKDEKDVVAVRSRLNSYLQGHLPLKEQLSVGNLSNARLHDRLGEAPTGLSGVRKAYWNALRAHQIAQAKYTRLKAELNDLSRTGTRVSNDLQAVCEEMLPLLREREKLRKVHIIQEALESMSNDDTSPTTVVLDEFVRARAGEMPLVPDYASTRSGYTKKVDTQFLDLKKAILTAKATADTNASHPADPGRKADDQAELYALQQTRNMLINWIEQQLVIIGDAQAVVDKPSEKLAVNKEDTPIPVSQDEVGQIYAQYLISRRKLLQALQHPEKYPYEAVQELSIGNGNPSKKAEPPDGLAAIMLPYLNPILDLQIDENATAQQVAACQRQSSSADTALSQLLRRLADESHLVVPGATSGGDWQKASVAAHQQTAQYVNAKIKSGMQDAGKAQDTLHKLDALSRVFKTGPTS